MGLSEGLCPNRSWLAFTYPVVAGELRSERRPWPQPGLLAPNLRRKKQGLEHNGSGVLSMQGEESPLPAPQGIEFCQPRECPRRESCGSAENAMCETRGRSRRLCPDLKS